MPPARGRADERDLDGSVAIGQPQAVGTPLDLSDALQGRQERGLLVHDRRSQAMRVVASGPIRTTLPFVP